MLTEQEKRQLLELGQPYSDAPAFEQQIRDKGILTSDLLKTQPDLSKQLTFANPNQDIFPVGSLNVEVPQAQPTIPEAKADVFSERLQKLNEQLLGQEALRTEKEKEAGIPELQKTQSELAGRVKQLQAEALAIPLQLQKEATGRGITAGGLAPLQTARLRENAIQALSTSALFEASRGNLAMALDQVERAVQQKYQPKREEIDVLTKNLQLILQSPAYPLAEKNRANQQLQAQKDRERQLDIQEQNAKNILITAMEAAKNGADSLTLRKIQKATTVAEALEIAAPFMRKEEKPVVPSAVSPSFADETIQTYAGLLAEGKINLANVPQNIRNAVVTASGGAIAKPLSDVAIKEIQQSESAVANLGALKKVVEDNLQFVGPISGLARFNPYSRARKVQAEIDRVRQQVGKTLEGGVLRKEDEEKYKKILATLADTPETAIYKIDSLIGSIQRDVATYKSLQQATGRFVPGGKQSTLEELEAKYNF